MIEIPLAIFKDEYIPLGILLERNMHFRLLDIDLVIVFMILCAKMSGIERILHQLKLSTSDLEKLFHCALFALWLF